MNLLTNNFIFGPQSLYALTVQFYYDRLCAKKNNRMTWPRKLQKFVESNFQRIMEDSKFVTTHSCPKRPDKIYRKFRSTNFQALHDMNIYHTTRHINIDACRTDYSMLEILSQY